MPIEMASAGASKEFASQAQISVDPSIPANSHRASPLKGSTYGARTAAEPAARECATPDAAARATAKQASTNLAIAAILLNAATGIGIILANKITLSFYSFPSPAFLAFCQLALGVVLISGLKALNKVEFQDVTWASCRQIMPMPVLFLGNALCGLSGTKAVSIPTNTALRKFSIVFTLLLERCVLGRKQSRLVHLSVVLMVAGAIVASARDMDFNLVGYLYIMLNNLFTASNYVVTKQKAEVEAFGAVGSLYYCALLSLPLSFLFMLPNIDHVMRFEQWGNPMFLVFFFLSTVMGCMLTFSSILLTKVCSGLTTCVVGCLRNIFPVYLGMLHVFDYTYNRINFVGHTISVIGALTYSAAKLLE